MVGTFFLCWGEVGVGNGPSGPSARLANCSHLSGHYAGIIAVGMQPADNLEATTKRTPWMPPKRLGIRRCWEGAKSQAILKMGDQVHPN